MSPDEIQREFPELPRLVAEWQEGNLALQSREFAELNKLLQDHRSARGYFLEAMQIDAELRWRMASTRKVDCALALEPEGTRRPIASILLNELAFRNEEGFADVYQCVFQSEAHAQLWLRLYPAIRACSLICIPSLSDTDAVVLAICKAVANRIHVDTSLDDFQKIATETTLERISSCLQDHDRGQAKALLSIVERCLDFASELDTVAIYESAEAVVPQQLSVEALRLLCNRYLIEQTPAEMAIALGVREQNLYAQLAEARYPIWKSCVAAVNLPDASGHSETLASLSRFLDAYPSEPNPSQGRSNSDPGFGPFDNLLSWLKGSPLNYKCFLTFAILHESLYRQLSLQKLHEELHNRRDEAFHRVVSDMVTQLEDVPAVSNHDLSPVPRPAMSAAAVGWFGALAAALLISATLAWWGAHRSGPQQPNSPVVTKSTPKQVEDRQLEPEPAVPPQPVVVGTIQSALDLPDDHPMGEIGASVVAGQTIEFAEGIVQVSTAVGSQWVLQGPIRLVMNEGGAATLEHGRVVGLNNGQMVPLVVRTPSATVVDVGTEFGVGVSDDQETSVAVYQGAVTLGDATDNEHLPTEETVAVEANRQAVVSRDGSLRLPPEPLVHDRDFIRPDEVQLRHEMQQGSSAAAEQVAFFEMLRVDGLLAYQGFHGASQAEEFVIGFAEPGMRPAGAFEFAANLDGGDTRFPSSRSLVLSNDNSVFFDLDVSDHSPMARSGLIDEDGMLGQQPGEIWVFWRSESKLPPGKQFTWVGLSMMHGNLRAKEEPLFVGKPSRLNTFGTHKYGSADVRQELDIDANASGVQSVSSDSKPHSWIVRFACAGAGRATASVWCDIDPSQVDSIAPHAQQHYDDLRFDRIRVEVSKPGDQGRCAFDQIILTSSREALASALSVASQQTTVPRQEDN